MKRLKKLKCPNCQKENFRRMPIHIKTETTCHYCGTKFNAHDNFIKT